MAHFEIKNLSFAYPEAKSLALDQVNLFVERGSYVALCGKSGSGKSTLLRHLKSVLTPAGSRSGEVYFEGKPLEQADLRTQSSKIGYVMQNPDNQIVTDKVWHELSFGLESLGCDPEVMRLRVAEMASYFGIQNWFHKNVAELSGGQKQLLNLASIMAMQPSVLILDEPTSQLDPIAASDFLNTVKRINIELGTSIIITEHRLEDVLPSADEAMVMDRGKIIAQANPREVGELLREKNDDMFAAMPSPMQIFYGAGGRGASPITVRQGRAWLSEYCQNSAPARTRIEHRHIDYDDAAAAVTAKEVWFRYEKDSPDVLRGVELRVPRSTLYAVVGGNGTGKSTMLKSLCGVVKPYRGKIELLGKRIDKYRSNELYRGVISMLPQDPQSLFVKKTIYEDLAEMLPSKELSRSEREARIGEIAELTGTAEYLSSHPYDVSGGEAQRAALAKVLLAEPQILLLDEPTKGIDNYFKLRLAKLFSELTARGITIIMVSHDVEFCARYADLVSMFFDGGIVATNTPNEFFSSNSFYTTAANRMSRNIFENAITNEDVISLCQR